MFMTNIKDLKNANLFSCNYDTYRLLLKNGFVTYGSVEDDYYFLLDDKLEKFIKEFHLNGMERSVNKNSE